MHALIFANGELELPPDWQALVAAADTIIAADGGAEHCRALDLLPDLLIGDLDSLDSAAHKDLEQQRVSVIQHPAMKDETDFELALLHAKGLGAERVTVLAGLGRRWDHSLANLLLAVQPAFAEAQISFLQGEQRICAVRGLSKLQARAGERVSLLPLAGDALGVTTSELRYRLQGETLLFGSSRGVSNIAEQDSPQVEIHQGVLLCIISPAELI